jgi:hypothetical protein
MIVPVRSPQLPATNPFIVFTPPDKALKPAGIQAHYELHLWLKPGTNQSEYYVLEAYVDGDEANAQFVWAGTLGRTFGAIANAAAIKILDGYVVRGNVTLKLTINNTTAEDEYPAGPQIWGYYYRVGRGTVMEPERRFIGQDSPDGVTEGVPIKIDAGEKEIIHVFENERIDELSLAFTSDYPDGSGNTISLAFEDANGVDIIPNHRVNIVIPASLPNSIHDPMNVYSIYQIPLGGGISPPALNLPNPHQISAELLDGVGEPLWVHGYFTRR